MKKKNVLSDDKLNDLLYDLQDELIKLCLKARKKGLPVTYCYEAIGEAYREVGSWPIT